MNMNYSDIKQELTDNWEQLTDTNYPDDILIEWANSAIPVYNNQIIADWQEMPSEFDDSWQEMELDKNAGIIARMTEDLMNYYLSQYTKAYNELCDEMEPADA